MNTHVLIVRQSLPGSDSENKLENICPHIFSKILVPVDFTDLSQETLSVVQGMQGIREIVLLHVVTEGDTKQEIDQEILHARDELEKIQKDLEQAGFRGVVHVRVADPVEKIESLAEEENVSLILMAAHEKNWIEGFLHDSTPFSVAKGAKRPVLILRMACEAGENFRRHSGQQDMLHQ